MDNNCADLTNYRELLPSAYGDCGAILASLPNNWEGQYGAWASPGLGHCGVFCRHGLYVCAASRSVRHRAHRKFHQGRIPITGGIAMFVGMFAAISFIGVDGELLLSMFIASLILVTVGVLDDRFHIPPAARLLSQIAAILLMYFGAGLGLAHIGDPFGFGTLFTGRPEAAGRDPGAIPAGEGSCPSGRDRAGRSPPAR